jgi:hypothetical protein
MYTKITEGSVINYTETGKADLDYNSNFTTYLMSGHRVLNFFSFVEAGSPYIMQGSLKLMLLLLLYNSGWSQAGDPSTSASQVLVV